MQKGKVRAYYIYPEVTRKYSREMQEKLNIEVTPVDNPRAVVEDCDIVVTAGPILDDVVPAVEAEWFKEGTLAAPVDYDRYWKDEALQLATKYFTDDRAQYDYYRRAGFFEGTPEPTGELADVVAGKIPGRENDKERIITMNMGIALADMATASKVYQKAIEKGVGTILPL